MKTYKGIITSLNADQWFVFGSNTQGRHGKGAALWALKNAGAKYGVSQGPQGRSYAIVTKDLNMFKHPSVPRNIIIDQLIDGLYCYAMFRGEEEFLVAYSGTGANLNGYTPDEMAEMFAEAGIQCNGIPANIIFEEVFSELVLKHLIQKGFLISS